MSGTIILLLAVVFVLAAIAKFRARDAFRAVLRSLIPAPLVNPLAMLCPTLELTLAAFLLSGIAPQRATVAAIAVLAGFTLVLAEMWRRGLQGCACFGETVNASTTSNGIVRNVILIATAASIIQTPGPIVFFGPDVSSFLGRLTVIVGALCFWSCFAALLGLRRPIHN